MKESVLRSSYVILLFLTVCCNFQHNLIGASAEDGEIVQTASATVLMPESIPANETSEKETDPTLDSIVNSDVLEPSVDEETVFAVKNSDNLDNLNKQVFTEVASQNSGVANEILNSGHPVVLTLSDTATAELQQRADIPNSVGGNGDIQSEPAFKNQSQDGVEAAAAGMNASEENRSESSSISIAETDEIEVPNVANNVTEERHEEIPSFSEWAQKRIEEAEKEQVNSSVLAQAANGKQGSGAKLRWKNYASLDCGAKVIASNPEAVSPWAVLSPSRDEYKLNTCTSRIWFVVELCEAIQAKKIDLANYELFSSSPKDFAVSVSDRFPTREWSNVGQFTAKDERDIQSFDLEEEIFGKYIKVEVKSHYGSEHFCPISLFRVYGISVFEVLQKEDPAHENRIEDDDDDGDEALDTVSGDSPKNLFTSATDVVISMVKKAAQVLGNKADQANGTKKDSIVYVPLINTCTTPSHLVVCNNCSDTLFGQIFELLSCRSTQIRNLIGIPFIRKGLVNSLICNSFGFDFHNRSLNRSANACPDCIRSFFPAKFLGAMCNTVAVLENKVVLNVSQQYPNVTQNVTSEDRIVNIVTSEPHVIKLETEEVKMDDGADEVIKPTDPLVLDQTESKSPSISSNISVTSQIKPTKALTSDVDLNPNPNTETSTVSVDESGVAPTESVIQSSETEGKAENAAVDQAADVAVEPPAPETESTETIEEHIEHFLSDFNAETTQNSVNSAAAASTPPGQKESVFLRLSNRIKALERNMSLSGQYLEELSRRYKKQVEEMQKLLEKTIFALTEESRKKDERNRHLEERLDQLAAAVDVLLSDRNSWSATLLWTLILASAASACVFAFCRGTALKPARPGPAEAAAVPTRRKSIDVVTRNPPTMKKRQRRPSDQALKIYRSSATTTTNESERRCAKEKKKKQQRKIRVLKRSNSINTLSEENDCSWSGSERGREWMGRIEDVPFALDEMEHSTLEDLPLPVNLTAKIDAPDFMQTAANARLNRSSSQNGSVGGDGKKKEKKSVSLDESGNKVVLRAVNGNGSSADETPKKERKGFKKLFRKVF